MKSLIDAKKIKKAITSSGQILGAHMFISDGFASAVKKAEEFGFNAIQIFSKSAAQWQSKEIDVSTAMLFKDELKKSNIKFTIVHASYLINLASSNETVRTKSINSFRNEIFRCLSLGIEYINLHPGSYGKCDEKSGIKLIAKGINFLLNEFENEKISIVIETTAGQGTSIGYKFEHLRDIIALINKDDKIKVCIDTAHIYAAGYDISTSEEYHKTFEKFDKLIGFDKLICFHINDTKKKLGERIDRHEDIGKGRIGKEGFKLLLNDERFKYIPKILETPKSKNQIKDLENISVLLSLIK